VFIAEGAVEGSISRDWSLTLDIVGLHVTFTVKYASYTKYVHTPTFEAEDSWPDAEKPFQVLPISIRRVA
jgi:hypothetical protein